MLTLVMLDVFMYYTLPQFLSNSFKIFQLSACIYKQSQKLCRLRGWLLENPADLVLHCFKTGYIKSLAWKKVY